MLPASLPKGTPVKRLRLVYPGVGLGVGPGPGAGMSGPVTKIRNIFPALAGPRLKRAATVLSSSVLIDVAWITLLGFPCSTAKTFATGPVLVTGGGPGKRTLLRKQAPPRITS